MNGNNKNNRRLCPHIHIWTSERQQNSLQAHNQQRRFLSFFHSFFLSAFLSLSFSFSLHIHRLRSVRMAVWVTLFQNKNMPMYRCVHKTNEHTLTHTQSFESERVHFISSIFCLCNSIVCILCTLYMHTFSHFVRRCWYVVVVIFAIIVSFSLRHRLLF